MHPEDRVHTVEPPLLNHSCGTPWRLFLGWLEDQSDAPRQTLTHLLKDACGTENHSDMPVVPAGVHDASVF